MDSLPGRACDLWPEKLNFPGKPANLSPSLVAWWGVWRRGHEESRTSPTETYKSVQGSEEGFDERPP